MTANLIEATPVDTGWARANWVPSIGSAFEEDLSDVDPSAQNAATAKQQQQSGIAGVVAGYKLNRGKVFISNNVPYVGRLNDGSSLQAPAGFIQTAIAKAVTLDIKGLAR